MINPDPEIEREMQRNPQRATEQYEMMKKIKQYYRENKNPSKDKDLENLLKERELEMFKSGLFRLS
jgi:hypothetical protein